MERGSEKNTTKIKPWRSRVQDLGSGIRAIFAAMALYVFWFGLFQPIEASKEISQLREGCLVNLLLSVMLLIIFVIFSFEGLYKIGGAFRVNFEDEAAKSWREQIGVKSVVSLALVVAAYLTGFVVKTW